MKKKRFFSVAILIAFSMFFSTVLAADDVFQLTRAAYPIYVNGQAFQSDKPILNYNGTTYVPLKVVLDMMGASTSWDADNHAVNIKTASNKDIQKYILLETSIYALSTNLITDYYQCSVDCLNVIYNINSPTTDSVKTMNDNITKFINDSSNIIKTVSPLLLDGNNQTINTQAISESIKSWTSMLAEFNSAIADINNCVSTKNASYLNDAKQHLYNTSTFYNDAYSKLSNQYAEYSKAIMERLK